MDETDLVAGANTLLTLPGGHVWVWLGTAAATGVYVIGVCTWCLGSVGWRARVRRVVTVGVAAALADGTCTWVLKPVVGRLRPCQEDSALHAAIEAAGVQCGSGASFPSNHAANTAAIAAATADPGLAALSLVIGVDRVVLGAHHPSDVLAGWGLGAAFGYGARRLERATRARRPAAAGTAGPTPER